MGENSVSLAKKEKTTKIISVKYNIEYLDGLWGYQQCE